MELHDIYELWDRFDRSSAAEMELDMHGVHLNLKKATQFTAMPEAVMTPSLPSPLQTSEELPVAAKKKTSSNHTVKAPLVGTFYRASSPDAEPFVRVGQQVKKGDVIGIIEAMKLMNEVVCHADGIVAEVLAEDGELVEYDQPLITIE